MFIIVRLYIDLIFTASFTGKKSIFVGYQINHLLHYQIKIQNWNFKNGGGTLFF